MLQDFVPELGQPLSDLSTGYERCAGYWSPDGTITRGTAAKVWGLLVDVLGLERLSLARARQLGFAVRPIGSDQHRGQHYAVNDLQAHRIKRVLAELHLLGHAVPDRGRKAYTFDEVEQERTVHRSGRRRWLICPEHNDNDPSALVNESGLVYCFACSKVVGHAVVHGETATYRSVVSSKGTASGRVRRRSVIHAPQEFSCTGTEEGFDGENRDQSLTAGSPRAHTRVWKGSTNGVRLLDHRKEVVSERYAKPRGYVLGTLSDKGMSKSSSACTDLLDLLKSANRQTGGAKTGERKEKAQAWHDVFGVKKRKLLPDRYVTLHLHECTKSLWIDTRKQTKEDGLDIWREMPLKFGPVAVGWVGVDLDGFTGAPVADADLEAVGPVMAAWAEAQPMFSGRLGVVRTSHFGVQFVLQLASERADGRAFYDCPAVQVVLSRLDSKALAATRAVGFTGGHADTSVHGLGRLVRRPGPRFDKAGAVYLTRLVWATE